MSDEQNPVVSIEVGAWLKGLAGDKDGLLTSERSNRCFHLTNGVIIDVSVRKLRCKDCGAEMDPYIYLDFLARDGDTILRARKQVQALSKKINELSKQEQNAKARVKRWLAKGPRP